MNGFLPVRNKVEIEPVHEERRDRGGEYGNVPEHLVQCLVSGELVPVGAAAPETLPVQADIPVADVVADEILDQPAGKGHIIVLVGCPDVLDEGVHERDDPPVDFRAIAVRNCRSLRVEVVKVGVEGEE